MFGLVPLNIHNTKAQKNPDLRKGICLKSLRFMIFQRIIFSCQHETELNLTVQFQVVSAVPLAEWYNLSGLCQDHNSEAENMLRNQDLNQLEDLGTYEIKNTNMNPNYPETIQVTQPTTILPSKGRRLVHCSIYIPHTTESESCVKEKTLW